MEKILLKIIETKEEALEAYAFYADTILKNPYFSELMKNPNFIITRDILYNYQIHNVNRMVEQRLSIIAVDTEKNKIIGLVCGEDLFEDPNPDFPENKPLFAKLGNHIHSTSVERFIKDGKLKRVKGVYLALTKLCTHKDYRRSRLAMKLALFAENVARERGFKYFFLNPSNPMSIKGVNVYDPDLIELGKLYFHDIEFEGTYPFKGSCEGYYKPHLSYVLMDLSYIPDQNVIRLTPKF
jgi:hypothetical protein